VNKWSRTCRRLRRRTSASGGRPEQRREQSDAVYVYPAPLSSSGRRRLRRRPNVSRPAALPSLAPSPFLGSMSVSAPSSR
jgi:hypothetical protein